MQRKVVDAFTWSQVMVAEVLNKKKGGYSLPYTVSRLNSGKVCLLI